MTKIIITVGNNNDKIINNNYDIKMPTPMCVMWIRTNNLTYSMLQNLNNKYLHEQNRKSHSAIYE